MVFEDQYYTTTLCNEIGSDLMSSQVAIVVQCRIVASISDLRVIFLNENMSPQFVFISFTVTFRTPEKKLFKLSA